jgi:hypothetical protein
MRTSQTKISLHFLLILVGVVLFLIPSCRKSHLVELQDIITRISEKWIPDQREGIADISVSEINENSVVLRGETDCMQLPPEIVDSLEMKGFKVTDSILILPGDDIGEYKHGVVALSVINLRNEPDHSAELVSQSIMGTPLKVLKSDDYWILVQTPDRYIAWTEKGSVQLMTGNDMKIWKNDPKVIYIDNSGWIYETIEEKAVIGDIVAGCIMKSKGELNRSLKVILPDGREGYVRKSSVMDFSKWKSRTIPEAGEIYRVASTMMGLPYLWGGSSAKAVDCSGFVQNVYFMNGIILSRDASLQALHGSSVDISKGWKDFQTGDLLFFGSVRNSKHRVTHVAIYKGDSEFIHSAGRVMVNSLDSTRTNFSKYRKNSLLSARRIIGSVGSPGITAVRDHIWY